MPLIVPTTSRAEKAIREAGGGQMFDTNDGLTAHAVSESTAASLRALGKDELEKELFDISPEQLHPTAKLTYLILQQNGHLKE